MTSTPAEMEELLGRVYRDGGNPEYVLITPERAYECGLIGYWEYAWRRLVRRARKHVKKLILVVLMTSASLCVASCGSRPEYVYLPTAPDTVYVAACPDTVYLPAYPPRHPWHRR